MRTEITVFDDLADAKDLTLAYNDLRSFDVEKISESDRHLLSTVRGIEINFQSQLYGVDQIGGLILDFNLKLNASNLFVMRSNLQPVSRIRSHLGLLKSEKSSKIDFLEKEFVVGINESYFAAIAKLETLPLKVFLLYFFDRRNNFVLLNSDRGFSFDSLDDLCEDTYHSNYGIDYLELILRLARRGECFIARAGGDGGRSYYTLQYFISEDRSHLLLDQARSYFIKNRLCDEGNGSQ
jgi:hypothetical protein